MTFLIEASFVELHRIKYRKVLVAYEYDVAKHDASCIIIMHEHNIVFQVGV